MSIMVLEITSLIKNIILSSNVIGLKDYISSSNWLPMM